MEEITFTTATKHRIILLNSVRHYRHEDTLGTMPTDVPYFQLSNRCRCFYCFNILFYVSSWKETALPDVRYCTHEIRSEGGIQISIPHNVKPSFEVIFVIQINSKLLLLLLLLSLSLLLLLLLLGARLGLRTYRLVSYLQIHYKLHLVRLR
jgi:hypothetical protein